MTIPAACGIPRRPLTKGASPKAGNTRPSALYIAFMLFMLLLLGVGVFMLVYGSMHNSIPVLQLQRVVAATRFPHA